MCASQTGAQAMAQLAITTDIEDILMYYLKNIRSQIETNDIHKDNFFVAFNGGLYTQVYRKLKDGLSVGNLHPPPPANCRFKEAICHFCGKVGHLKSACITRKKGAAQHKKKEPQARPVMTVESEHTTETEDYPLYTLQSSSSTPPIKLPILLEGLPVEMELDTGAAFSLMAESNFRQLFPAKELTPTTIRLCAYSGEAIEVLGSIDITVTYKEQSACVPLLVVKHSGPSLLGRNWLQKFKLDWREIHSIQLSPTDALLEKYHEVFQETLGTLQNFKAHIYVDPAARPKYCKARSIPYAIKTKVEEELDRLVAEGTLELLQMAEWESPVVPVIKSGKKSVRICGDFK